MKTDALFSEDRRFRYWLTRVWDESLPMSAFIGLNPSTATETVDDPTIRRCINFAKSWGFGGILMLNVYAFRATDPKDMFSAYKRGTDIIGGRRNYVESLCQYCVEFKAYTVIAAWGAHARMRGHNVISEWKQSASLIIPPLSCLAKNTDGSPKHPLYLKGDLKPVIL